jgi:hypothetical protein
MSRLAILASAVTVAVLATVVAAAPAHADATARPRTAVVTHYRTLEKMLRRFSRQAGSASRPAVYAAR